MPIEIEKKWLVTEKVWEYKNGIRLGILPAGKLEINQAYLLEQENVTIKVSSIVEKSKKKGELCISEKLGENKYNKTKNKISFDLATKLIDSKNILSKISKTTYRYSVKEGVFNVKGIKNLEVNVFHGVLNGLSIIKVNFDSEEDINGFIKPDYFENEIDISDFTLGEFTKEDILELSMSHILFDVFTWV